MADHVTIDTHDNRRTVWWRLAAAAGIVVCAMLLDSRMPGLPSLGGVPVRAVCDCPDFCGESGSITCPGPPLGPFEDCYVTGASDFCRYPSTGCSGGEYSTGTGCCWVGQSPIVVDVSGNGFALTSLSAGVSFAIAGERLYRAAWTEPQSDDAWLALDRNGNGVIDNCQELFGDNTPQPTPPPGHYVNGFLALAEFDKVGNGGNGDGVIDTQDSVFTSLRLWQDRNHDGYSQSRELHLPTELRIEGFDLRYQRSKRVDEFGNEFKYRAKIYGRNRSEVGKWAADVYLRLGTLH
jgi:hypothetical protein